MRKKTILVIEDNELNRKLVKALLQRGPYNVLEAIDAEGGIQLAQEHKPDLILMDIQLPGMDGLSATRIIKEDPELKGTPVVALTSYAMDGDVEKAKKAGCDGYISKPINTRSFLDTIKNLLPDGHETESLLRKDAGGMNRILVVDDDPLNVKLLAAKLPQDQYEVIKAYSGKEAIEKAAAESLDLILLDIMMPGMDGYEVTRSLKSDPMTSDIPIILVTSLDGTEDKVKGLEAGADDFINKPFNTVELLSRVQSLIRLKQYREQLAARVQSKAVFEMAMGNPKAPEEKTVVPSVLLVEDNPNDARLIQEYLKGSSFRVELAKNGEEALTRAEKNKIDLILLDILLPGIDGLEVCRRLKESERTRDVQILMVSCLADLENKIKSLHLGADDFLLKPVNPHELKARVKALLKKKDSLDRLKGGYETLLHTAITDNLTGLDNCAYFKHFLELEIKRSQRHKYPLALIMMDIDDFKLLNDALGILAGTKF